MGMAADARFDLTTGGGSVAPWTYCCSVAKGDYRIFVAYPDRLNRPESTRLILPHFPVALRHRNYLRPLDPECWVSPIFPYGERHRRIDFFLPDRLTDLPGAGRSLAYLRISDFY
jgi:hypothetical protein